MVTCRQLALLGLGLLSGCGVLQPNSTPAKEGSAAGTAAGTPPPGAAGAPIGTVDPGGTGPQYPGTGFIVHEWGTNTIVVGTDGAPLLGLHHEEEDLPAFAYDRKSPSVARSPSQVKMETPVTYFYSDAPLTAHVDVSFPRGVFTQWYPAVVAYFPWVLAGKGDPVFDKSFPFSSPECRTDNGALKNGQLDWGDVDVLARDAVPTLPDASLDQYTWSYARAVASNPVRVIGEPDATSSSGPHPSGAQEERFLFYRGLGDFPLDVKITAAAGPTGDDGGLVLTNGDAANAIGAVFVLRVEADHAAFKVLPAGLVPSGSLAEVAPPATQPIDAYAQDLAKAMVTELDKAGLYHDESVAMVKTWARQWFRTPGVRVLYLAPRPWTDAQIPLTISPAPQQMVRVMMIRVEAITRVQEQADLVAAHNLDGDASAQASGEAYFAALGRFAEPRLRRAMAQMAAGPSATSYLAALSGVDASVRIGE